MVLPYRLGMPPLPAAARDPSSTVITYGLVAGKEGKNFWHSQMMPATLLSPEANKSDSAHSQLQLLHIEILLRSGTHKLVVYKERTRTNMQAIMKLLIQLLQLL